MKVPIILLVSALLSTIHHLSAQIRLPKLLSDGVVLQRHQPITIWGWASSNEHIHLSFQEETFETTANEWGEWELILPAQRAGGPFELTIKGKNEIKIHNVLFGDLWLCSGQSNMELNMGRLKGSISGRSAICQ